MAGINKVILVGNLGDDPDIKYTQSETCVANFNMATSERWKDRDGEQQERTEWHRIVFFGKVAEIIGEYATKGMKVYVEGKLRTEKYTDKDGIERWTTKIYGDDFQMLSSRDDNQRGNRPRDQRDNDRGQRGQGRPQQRTQQRGHSGGQRSAPAGQGSQRPQPRREEYSQQAPRRQAPQQEPPIDDFADDDIPF